MEDHHAQKTAFSLQEKEEIGRLVSSGRLTRKKASSIYGASLKSIEKWVKLYQASSAVPAPAETGSAGGPGLPEPPKASAAEPPAEEDRPVPGPKRRRGKAAACAAAVLLLAAVAWYFTRPRFHDLTIELGTDSVSIAEFMTPYASGSKVSFVTDPASVDITRLGTYPVTLRHGKREETVLLSVVDTTPPAVTFRPEVEAGLAQVPSPEAFVESVEDESEVRFSYEVQPEKAVSYGEQAVTILVTDQAGNVTRGESKITYVWLRRELAVEYGTPVTVADLVLDPDLGEKLISQEDLDALNAADLGDYYISSTLGGKTSVCHVVIQDTTPPVLKLRDVRIILTQTAGLRSFVSKAEDNYGEVKLRMLTNLTFSSLGVQNVTIEARDLNGNVTVGHCRLTIKEDDVPPTFSGLSEMTVEKHSRPDFRKGVSAKDNIDGAVSFTVDESGVDLDKAGTYYVKYTASDKKGNTVTSRRKVTVLHDEEDTSELARQVFAKISDRSPVGISIFIRKYISYSNSWGDSDPVWYGLTNRRGNCYVHAKTLQKMLSLAGYENKLIWTTNKEHYWNLVKVGGRWWHIDSTPASLYPTSLMNDAERLAHLKPGRDWDRDAWPACP